MTSESDSMQFRDHVLHGFVLAFIVIDLILSLLLVVMMSWSTWARSVILWSYIPCVPLLMFLLLSLLPVKGIVHWSWMLYSSLFCAGLSPFLTFWSRSASSSVYINACLVILTLSVFSLMHSINRVTKEFGVLYGCHDVVKLSGFNRRFLIFIVQAPLTAEYAVVAMASGVKDFSVGDCWVTIPRYLGHIHIGAGVISLLLSTYMFLRLMNDYIQRMKKVRAIL